MRLQDIITSARSLARTGWMLRGVPPSMAETVSSHSFAAALLALELARRVGVDPYRAAAIALVHDLAETRVGDIAKVSGIDEAKRSAELRALDELEVSDLVRSLVREFYESKSDEAVIARAADLAATVMASRYYRSLGLPVDEIEQSSLKELDRLTSSWNNGRRLGEALREIGVYRD